MVRQSFEQLKAEEEELQKQCAELERLLRQDALSFENEALEVQLLQIQDDHAQLREELRGTREFYGRRIADMTNQLEERARTTSTAEGHADCLSDLLLFHEDNGVLAGSYWQTQCVKRDDSIRFLTLKLQEYTVNSAEYHARRSRSATAELTDVAEAEAAASPVMARTASAPLQGVNQAAFKAAERAFKALNERHSGLCEELQQAEEHACSLERAIEECEVRCAKLHHNSEDTDVDLDAKIRLCEAARAEVYQLPPWALRCAWRDALDLRASQLERVSGQLDGTKRSLDAANEELNWQATSAEALRTRLTDVLQATLAEERRGNQFSLEEARRRQTLQVLLGRWFALRPEGPLPTACEQAQKLLAEG